ncbi:MAG: diaminopimelate epimerase [Alphaproteobacteria bacterium]
MTATPFLKMHGLGNDFVVFDARQTPLVLSPVQTRALADRRFGVGCDQVIAIEPAPANAADADAFMRIFNADGGEVNACGNATRCVAHFLMAENGRTSVAIATGAGVLTASRAGAASITVDMGAARDGWRDIPLAREADTLHLPIEEGPLADPAAVDMGNPHAVFFAADADAVDLAQFGPILEHHPLFPDRANIEVVQVLAPDRLRVRVWERGAGLTRACGTGACAALVAAHRRGLAERRAEILLDGGALAIDWHEEDGHVLMTGPVATSFAGAVEIDRLTETAA